jgi:hypothetical protein
VFAIKNSSCLLRWAGFVLAACVSSRAGAAIDFTPTTGERVLEGIVFKQLVFHENGRPITYEQPRGWKYSGEAAHIRFTPPEIGQAQAEIIQAPLAQPQSFDDSTRKNLQTQVLGSVPSGSQNGVIIAEEQNPLTINRQPTYTVTVGYNLSGEDYRLSVIFANLDKTQLQFRIIARKKDFGQVNRLFRGSLFSLQWH